MVQIDQEKKDYTKSTRERLDDEIEKAFQSVTITKFQTEQLHSNWRDHLFRLSAGVVLLAMHQYSSPVGECIADLKTSQQEFEVSHLTAAKVIFSDGLVELVNVIIAFLLFRFTSRKEDTGNFSSISYMTAATLIPFCLGLYFNTKRVGCIVGSDGNIVIDDHGDKAERQFPVAVLFHMIVTGCFMFMKYYMEQCNTNLDAVTILYKELSSKNSKKKK